MKLKFRTKIRDLIIRESFSPGFYGLFLNPFYFARAELYRFIKQIAPKLHGSILDVGCGSKPYKTLFDFTEYVGLEIDTPENRRRNSADVFYDGHTIPFNNDYFDSVVCSQVLEHVFNPDEFIIEIHRIIKPNGLLLLCVPFVWDEHEHPFDYARYSSFGLKSLLKKNGFEVIEQYKTLADIRIVFQVLNAYWYKTILKKNNRFRLALIFMITSMLNVIGIILWKIFPNNNDLYLDNIVLCKKR